MFFSSIEEFVCVNPDCENHFSHRKDYVNVYGLHFFKRKNNVYAMQLLEE